MKTNHIDSMTVIPSSSPWLEEGFCVPVALHHQLLIPLEEQTQLASSSAFPVLNAEYGRKAQVFSRVLQPAPGLVAQISLHPLGKNQ